MLPRDIVRSSYIIILVLCSINNGVSYILDLPKCIKYEEVTEPVKVETKDIKVVLFNKKLPAITKVKYGQHLKLICDIQLSAPMTIRWLGRYESLTGDLSNNDTEMDIKANIELHGEYVTCEASLVSNPKKIKTFGTSIAISNLAPPVISDLTVNKTTVMENNQLALICKIVGGIPQPTIRWQMKNFTADAFQDLTATTEELIFENATFANVGQYLCTATNVKGQATKITEVVVQKAPVVMIEEGTKKTFPYGNTTEFTCRVKGYPLPKTLWRDNNGYILDSEETIINWHEKISRIQLQNLNRSNNYTCSARNTLGKAISGLNVTVLSPFVVHRHPENTTNVHYGATTSIHCVITSSFPMKIKWYHQKTNLSGLKEIHTDKVYNMRANNTVLTIASTNMDVVGNYRCLASLVSDENENKSFTTHLRFDDLALPSISRTNKIFVVEENLVTISCKIGEGVPRPTLKWLAKKHGEKAYKDLNVNDEDLSLENITIYDAGYYRCEVKNPIGQSNSTTELLVRKPAVTSIEEGTAVTVMYGSNYTFTCKVIGYPLPEVLWADTEGDLIPSTESPVNEHEITSRITVEEIKIKKELSCSAGEHESFISVTVLSPIVVHQHPDFVTNVHYAATTDLVCNITSPFPLNIKWYHNSTEVHTSDRFTISTNETVLSIKSMDLDLLGSYRCKATLVSDETVTKEFSTNVQIDDLQSPIITENPANSIIVVISNFEELPLTCKASGHPEPVITWTFQPTGSSSFETLGTGESVCSTNMGYAQAGTYKCTASNIVGEDSWVIYIVVV